MMQRTNDPGVIEHRLLELAYTTDTRITAPVLAYYAGCSIEDAEKVLDNLVARDRIAMEVNDDGSIEYQLADRQKLKPRDEGPPPPEPPMLVRIDPEPLALRHNREANPGLAAVLSLFMPGAGQLYAGRIVGALMWFLAVSAGYYLVLPGLILHVFCIVSAASSAHRLNSSVARLQLRHGTL